MEVVPKKNAKHSQLASYSRGMRMLQAANSGLKDSGVRVFQGTKGGVNKSKTKIDEIYVEVGKLGIHSNQFI